MVSRLREKSIQTSAATAKESHIFQCFILHAQIILIETVLIGKFRQLFERLSLHTFLTPHPFDWWIFF